MSFTRQTQKTILKPRSTNAPRGKHPDHLMPQKMFPRGYRIGAEKNGRKVSLDSRRLRQQYIVPQSSGIPVPVPVPGTRYILLGVGSERAPNRFERTRGHNQSVHTILRLTAVVPVFACTTVVLLIACPWYC